MNKFLNKLNTVVTPKDKNLVNNPSKAYESSNKSMRKIAPISRSWILHQLLARGGKKAYRIFEPSSGGKGNRLNSAKEIFNQEK